MTDIHFSSSATIYYLIILVVSVVLPVFNHDTAASCVLGTLENEILTKMLGLTYTLFGTPLTAVSNVIRG